MLTALANPDHTDVIVTSATELVKAVLALAGIFATVGFGIGVPIHRKAVRERTESRQKQDAIHDQVANTHATNLRDDLDGMVARLDRISLDIGDVKDDVGVVKRDVASVGRKVAGLDTRLTNHIDGR